MKLLRRILKTAWLVVKPTVCVLLGVAALLGFAGVIICILGAIGDQVNYALHPTVDTPWYIDPITGEGVIAICGGLFLIAQSLCRFIAEQWRKTE